MKTFTLAIACLFLTSCGTFFPRTKFEPEYQGVDDRAKGLVDEFLHLSRQNNIRFTNTVTLGFKKINQNNVVGICSRTPEFREIDIDIDYWEDAHPSQRLAVVFHELTHCYCGRIHDWGSGTLYPDTEKERVAEAESWFNNGGVAPAPGRYIDGCPTSLMYPTVVDADCVWAHYAEYVVEMFNRCKPY